MPGHQVLENLGQDLCKVGEGRQRTGQPWLEVRLEGAEGVGAVDLVELRRPAAGSTHGLLRGGVGRDGIEMVAQDLGAKVLLGGEPGETGELFQGQAVLDPLEGLLDIPLMMPL